MLLTIGGLPVHPCGFFVLLVALFGVNNEGSPTLAAEWREDLARFDGPDDAAAADPEVVAMRFPDGCWALVKGQNSHGGWIRGGGTVVVRDSTGRTRFFSGHVCGRGRSCFGHGGFRSLDELYKYLAESRFKERPLP
jgi:hypothetical protein